MDSESKNHIRLIKGEVRQFIPEAEDFGDELPPQNKVALVIMPHPDDAEFSCAGTVAKWVQEGWEVSYVICTDAGSGGPDEATDVSPEARRQVSETRRAEQ